MNVEQSGEDLLRERFGTKGIRIGSKITDLFRRYMEAMEFFFIATANKQGICDCSYRGGNPAIKVIDEETLIFPDYRGNGAFQSLGNLIENPSIGMLFIDFTRQQRLRVNGIAEIVADPESLTDFPDSIQIVKVRVQEVYLNCSQRIPKMMKVQE